jgi:hypothetical protein
MIIVSVYHRFPSLSGRAQISWRRSSHPSIPCLSTVLRPPVAHWPSWATRRRAGHHPSPAAHRAGLVAERVPDVFPLTGPSPVLHPPPPPLCPGVAQPHTILPVAASWSTRWPRLLRSPSTRVKHSRKPSGGGLGPPPRAPQRRLPRRRWKRHQGRPLSARFSSWTLFLV